jgi:hypothetical protein
LEQQGDGQRETASDRDLAPRHASAGARMTNY